MVDCDYCHKDIYLGFTCRRCGGYFCSKHRLPENHECKFIDLKKEDLALKIQLERETGARRVKYEQRPAYKETRKFSRYRRDDDDFFVDDEDYDRYYSRPIVRMDLSLSLIMFVLMAIIDVFFFTVRGSILLLFVIIVHAIFLPILFNYVLKQKRGQLTPRMLLKFFQIMILYMVVYLSLKIIISIILLDYFAIIINLFFGVFMIYIGWRFINQIKRISF
ncbi:MAG: AN1-type zinc finger domain-containing protein [Promethearchaeota archaeon]